MKRNLLGLLVAQSSGLCVNLITIANFLLFCNTIPMYKCTKIYVCKITMNLVQNTKNEYYNQCLHIPRYWSDQTTKLFH
jgi:hypothetical protein